MIQSSDEQLSTSAMLNRMKRQVLLRFFCEDYEELLGTNPKDSRRVLAEVWRGELEYRRRNGTTVEYTYEDYSFDLLVRAMYQDYLRDEHNIPS